MTGASAVVPTLGDRASLATVVAALRAEEGVLEVVVAWDRAEGGVPPGERGALDAGGAAGSPPVRHVFSGGRRGPGAARNAGARAAAGGFIVFVDDDVIPRAGAVPALLRCCRDGGTAAAGAIRPHPSVPENRYTQFAYAGPVHRRDPAGGACDPLEFCAALAAVPRAAFLASGGFDERIGIYYEDGELAFRLARDGVALRWCPGATGEHLRAMDRRWFLERCRLLGARIDALRGLAPGFAATIRILPAWAAPLAPALRAAWPLLRRTLPLAERLPPALGLPLLRAAHAAGVLRSGRPA